MTLLIISADERLKETKGITGCIFGKSGIGKTSLLWTLPAAKTLFFDLEAGDLAIEGWPGDTIRPRTWPDCRDIATFIGGPNPALRDDQSYSQAHYETVTAQYGDAGLSINTRRFFSIASRLPVACASTGVRANRKPSARKPASRIRVGRMACMARR